MPGRTGRRAANWAGSRELAEAQPLGTDGYSKSQWLTPRRLLSRLFPSPEEVLGNRGPMLHAVIQGPRLLHGSAVPQSRSRQVLAVKGQVVNTLRATQWQLLASAIVVQKQPRTAQNGMGMTAFQ